MAPLPAGPRGVRRAAAWWCPPRHHAWLTERTGDLRRRLSAGGYAVHGDLPGPSERPGVTAPDEEGVLALAMRVLLGPTLGVTVAPSRATEATTTREGR